MAQIYQNMLNYLPVIKKQNKISYMCYSSVEAGSLQQSSLSDTTLLRERTVGVEDAVGEERDT